jgi:hypothetical protein
VSIETLAVTGLAICLVVLALGASALGRRVRIREDDLRADAPSHRGDSEVWEHGGEGHFHRGLSFALLGDAFLTVLVGAVLNPVLPDLGPLVVVLGVTVIVAHRVFRSRRSPIL